MEFKICFLFLITYYIVSIVKCSDITHLVFGKDVEGLPAAFGDFNSDELTDVFVLRNNEKTVEILLAHEEEPLLRSLTPKKLECTFNNSFITSVVPGDFDGDAFMDVMVTTTHNKFEVDKSAHTNIYIFWGGANHMNCSDEDKPAIKMIGQPLALDYNQDMIVDLFGEDREGERKFWVFNHQRTKPMEISMNDKQEVKTLTKPHAHAFLDLNEDFTADLFVTAEKKFEVWYGNERQSKFIFNRSITHPQNFAYIGQSSFIDIELKGKLDLITPVCYDGEACKQSALLVYQNGDWHNLDVNFKNDADGTLWRFYMNPQSKYTNVITLRSGDFNMDGYPDILATLAPVDAPHPQSFLLENVECPTPKGCGNYKRSFAIKWNALNPFRNGTVMGTFFDFFQDGVLDVILVTFDGQNYKSAAFKNSLDYDANFMKVMVLTGLYNKSNDPMIMGRVGKKRRTYGTNLPGPSISYKTQSPEGNPRHSAAAQLPQSAHFSLNLPYTIFGLGRTANFVDSLTVGLSNHSRDWQQIIPNSQMVIIPWPPNVPSKWKAQLFVTPSKLILMSVAALTGVCGFITIIIGALYWKERQEDKKERLSAPHGFHFDAM